MTDISAIINTQNKSDPVPSNGQYRRIRSDGQLMPYANMFRGYDHFVDACRETGLLDALGIKPADCGTESESRKTTLDVLDVFITYLHRATSTAGDGCPPRFPITSEPIHVETHRRYYDLVSKAIEYSKK